MQGCDEMMNNRKGFMPGCSLSAYSPENVAKTTEYLKEKFSDISIIQKCCGKPTKSIEQVNLFNHRFGSLLKDINDCNIDQMIVACQSCLNTLKTSNEFKTISLWELFPIIGLPENLKGKARYSDIVFSIHDSCPTRYESKLQDGVRWILNELGYKTAEPEYTRNNTRCCGLNYTSDSANFAVAKHAMSRRVKDFPTQNIVVYCSACRSSMLIGGGKAWHILDLIWGPVIYNGSLPPKNVLKIPVKAWINKYRSKIRINKIMR